MSDPSTNRTVLVVDDDVGIRELLTRSLSFEGFDVLEAANGLDALTQLRKGRRPSVIVLDLRMPVMDGWAFRIAQRADPRIARIPVVILSGADTHRFQEIEAVATLEKPVSLSLLADCLHRVLEDT